MYSAPPPIYSPTGSVGAGSLFYGSPPQSPMSPLGGSHAPGAVLPTRVISLYGINEAGQITKPKPSLMLDVNQDGEYTAGIDGLAGHHPTRGGRQVYDRNGDGQYQLGVDGVAGVPMGLSGRGVAPFVNASFNLGPVPGPRKQRGNGRQRGTRTKRSGPSVNQGRVDTRTEMAQWFVSGMPRAEVRQMAKEMQRHGVLGNFLVRDVSSDPGCYGLIVKTSKGIANYLVEKMAHKRHIGGQGFRMRGTKHVFPNLADLTQFYCDMPRPPFTFPLVPLNLDASAGRNSVPLSPRSVMSLADTRVTKSPKYSTSAATGRMAGRHQQRSPGGDELEIYGEVNNSAIVRAAESDRKIAQLAAAAKQAERDARRARRAAKLAGPAAAVSMAHQLTDVARGALATGRSAPPPKTLTASDGTEVYTVVVATTPPTAVVGLRATIMLMGTKGPLDLALHKAASSSTRSDGENVPYYQFKLPDVGSVTAVQCKVEGDHAKFSLDRLHISCSSGLRVQSTGGPTSFPRGAAAPQTIVVKAAMGAAETVGHDLYRDVMLSAADASFEHPVLAGALVSPQRTRDQTLMTKQMLALRVAGPSNEVKGAIDASAPTVPDPVAAAQASGLTSYDRQLRQNALKMASIDDVWSTELGNEEIRILQAMDHTEAEIDNIRHEDVNGAVHVGEIQKRIGEIEQSRGALELAAKQARQRVRKFESEKAAGAESLAGNEASLLALGDQLEVAKVAKAEAHARFKALGTELNSSQRSVAMFESRWRDLAVEETATRATMTEAEDQLALLLIEEQALLAREKSVEMEAAKHLAAHQLEQMEMTRALRELAAEQLDAEEKDRRAAALMRRTNVQDLLEADVVGIDAVLNDPDVVIHEETKLAAAESQVRMLEEKLMLADAHLNFAETTATLVSQFPNAESALLARLNEYETSLQQMGGVPLEEGDEAWSDYDSEIGDYVAAPQPDVLSAALRDAALPNSTNAKRYVELYRLLVRYSGTVQYDHLHEVLQSTGASEGTLAQFKHQNPAMSATVTELEFVRHLCDAESGLPGLLQAAAPDLLDPSAHANRHSMAKTTPTRPTSVGGGSGLSSDFELPQPWVTDVDNELGTMPWNIADGSRRGTSVSSGSSDRDEDFGFPDEGDEVEETTGATHVKHLMRVWQLREQDKAKPAKISKDIRAQVQFENRGRGPPNPHK